MKFNILKDKKIRGKVLLFIGLLIPSISNSYNSYAGKTTPYYIDTAYSGFIDPEVPPAVKLTETVDGMPAGTILYRTQYLGFTYYCPVTPKELQGTDKEINPTKYRQWGPWDMPVNQVAYQESVAGTIVPGFIPSSYTYSSATIAKGSSIEGIKINSSGVDYRTTLGTLTSAYSGKIKSVTNYKTAGDPYLYFDLSSTNLAGVGAVNVGRISLSKATVSGKMSLYYSDTRPIYNRFTKYGVYSDSATKQTSTLTDASHQLIQTGKWVNPSYAPYDLAGKKGEWSRLGYNADGDPVTNPYHISTSLYFRGNSDLKDYDFRYTPWNPNDSKSGETETNKTGAYNVFPARTKYDTDSKYYNAKYNLVKKLFDDGVLKRKLSTLDADIKDMLNRISFRNHPENEATVMTVQRRLSTSPRSFTIFNELSDIYLHSISVTDSSGIVVASYSYNINTGAITRKDGTGIKAGQTYTVKVYLGNTKNKSIIATKNQTQIGIKSNYKAFDSLPITSTTSTQSKEVANTMGDTKGSKSSAMTYTITAPNADFFDIYAYVGYKHLGTDNLDESNDVGRVRLNINGSDYAEQYEYSYADLVAKKIELLDSNDNVVYSYTRGASAPSINNAVAPGTTYKIRYSIINEGADSKYRVRSKGYWSGNNWIPGTWGSWIFYDCSVNATYKYTRIGSNGSATGNDKIPGNQQFTASISKPLTMHGGNKVFKIYAGTQIIYTSENVEIEYPYLNTNISFTTNAHANNNTSNDNLSVTIAPQYDASISNVRIYPINEYSVIGTENVDYLVTYDATLSAPSFMQSGGNGMMVETSINIGGKTQIFSDMLSFGANTSISHTVKNVPVTGGDSLVATVILNYHNHTYETNYNNNRASSSVSRVVSVKNPFTGNNSDTVKWIDTSNNGASSVGGGSLNNNCLIPRTGHDWGVNHIKLNWIAEQRYTDINGSTVGYKKYKVTSKQDLGWKNYYERFNITSVLYRSKDTKDKKLGNDGWIELTNASQKDLATIKAGYGFELKVVAVYKTNVIKSMPVNVDQGTSGTYYTNTYDGAKIALPSDIFVELPGSNSSRKILSVTGYAGTTKGLNVEEKDISTSSETIKQFTYTIKATNSLGIKDSNKIFTPTNLKDGNYKVSIYTAPVAGIPSINKGEYALMCDRKDVYVKIKGSYTDDLNSHTTQ